jgi:hypothetical protein
MSDPLPSSTGSHAAELNQNHIATLSGAVNNAPASFPVAASADASGFESDSGIEHTGSALQPMEAFMRAALDRVFSLPNSDAAPAGAPALGLAAAAPAGAPALGLAAAAPAGAPALHLAAAPAGAPDAEPDVLPSAFLEPVRGDLGQRWVDVNLASAEDIWSMFCNPNINGGCVFMLEPFASF